MAIDYKKVERIKNQYQEGMKVRCIYMEDAYAVPRGTVGVVTSVDDMGTIHVNWENGSSLGVILECDRIAIV